MTLGTRSWGSDVYFASHAVQENIIGFTHAVIDQQRKETITWQSIIDIDHVWYYLENVLIPSIINDNDQYIFANHAILMGGMRIRQYRVKQKQCTYKGVTFDCFSSSEYKDNMHLSTSNLSLNWQSTKQNDEAPFIQGVRDIYPGSGFVVILARNQIDALNLVSSLKTDIFIDGQTRLLSIDFNLFNPTAGLHTITRLLFEFGRDGDVTSQYIIETWRLLRYENNIITLIFDILFVICIIYATITEIIEICNEPFKSYCDFWNTLDWVSIAINWSIILLLILQRITANDIDLVSKDNYSSLLYLNYLIEIENYFVFISGMFLFIRIFKYFQFSSRLSFVFNMLGIAALDIFIFCFVIAIFICAFGFGGFIIFNSDVLEFRTMWFSIANMSRAVISGLDYTHILDQTNVSNWIFATIYYIFWGVLVLLILANVFIAILSESYSHVQRKFKKDYSVKQIFKDAFHEAADEARAIKSKVKNALSRRDDDVFTKDELAEMMNRFHSKDRISRGVLLETVLEMRGNKSNNVEEILDEIKEEYNDDERTDHEANNNNTTNDHQTSVRKSLALLYGDSELKNISEQEEVEPAVELSNSSHQDWEMKVKSKSPSISTLTVSSGYAESDLDSMR